MGQCFGSQKSKMSLVRVLIRRLGEIDEVRVNDLSFD